MAQKTCASLLSKLNPTNDTLSPMSPRSPSPVSHLLREYKTKIYYSISLKHLNMCTTVTQVSLTMPLQTLLCIGRVAIVGSYFWRSDRISRFSSPLLYLFVYLWQFLIDCFYTRGNNRHCCEYQSIISCFRRLGRARV